MSRDRAARSVPIHHTPYWWMALLGIVLATFAMPLIHGSVFGIERIYTAMLTSVARIVGGPLTSGAGEAIRDQLNFALSPAGGAMAAFGAVFDAFVFAGLLAGMGKLTGLPDGSIDILGAALWGRLGTLVLQILGWGAAVAAWDLNDIAIDQWTKVAPSNLATLIGISNHPVLTTLLGSVDFYLLPGLGLTAWLLVRASGRESSWGMATATVLGAWAIIIALKVVFTLGTGIPL